MNTREADKIIRDKLVVAGITGKGGRKMKKEICPKCGQAAIEVWRRSSGDISYIHETKRYGPFRHIIKSCTVLCPAHKAIAIARG